MTPHEKESLMGELTRLAAAMVHGDEMPSVDLEDLHLPSTTPKHVRQRLRNMAVAAQARSLTWGHALIDLCEKVKAMQ